MTEKAGLVFDRVAADYDRVRPSYPASLVDAACSAASLGPVFSATAFHWVDPAVSWAKAARLLHPGGVLALLSHVGGPQTELDPEWLAAGIESARGKVSSKTFATLVTARVRA